MIEAEVMDKDVLRLLRILTLKGKKLPMKRIAVIGSRSVNRNFQEGGRPEKWAPLAPSTIERQGRGGPGAQPLQDTGALKSPSDESDGR